MRTRRTASALAAAAALGLGGAGVLAVAGVFSTSPASAAVTAGTVTAGAVTAGTVTAGITNGQLNVAGTPEDDHIALRLSGNDQTVVAVDVGDDGFADFLFPRDQFTSIAVDLGAGADVARIDQSAGVFTDTELTRVSGGDGNDTLLGGSGAETLNGGPGADVVDGNIGNDTISLGDGDDVYQWDPGDGSDTVLGQAGNDRVVFNGSNAAETYDLAASGALLRLHRDIANIDAGFAGIEQIDLSVRSGADRVTVHDLTGTPVTGVNVDLAGNDPNQGDTALDQVIAEGTAAADNVTVTGAGGIGRVTGLRPTVTVAHGELANDTFNVNLLGGNDQVNGDPAAGTSGVKPVVDGGEGIDTVTTKGTDGPDMFSVVGDGGLVAVVANDGSFYEMTAESLVLNGLGGDDTITSTNGVAAVTALTLIGDAGADTLRGGDGSDVLSGGPGADFVDGNIGADTAILGDGDDVYQWDPGDGSDNVNGGPGTDRLLFNGSNAGEIIDLSANGIRLRLHRDIGNVTMDAGSVEQVDVIGRGSSEVVTVHDLTGTPVTGVNVDLAGNDPNQGDAAADQVIVEGTDRADSVDTISVATTNGVTSVAGLAASVSVLHADLALDRLDINTLAGDDVVTTQLPTGIQVFVDGNPV